MFILLFQVVFPEVCHVGVDVFAVVEGGVVLCGDDKFGMVRVGVAAQGAFILLEVVVVTDGFVVGHEAVDGDELCGVGEEEGVDFVAAIGVVLRVEVGDTVLQFGCFDGAVVDDDDDVVLLFFAIAVDESFWRQVFFDNA